MWRGKRRIKRLEGEIIAAKADQADLRRRVELFEMIARAAGAGLTAVPSAPLPAGLVAAARESHADDVPVLLDVAGTEAIAVVSGAGDPREWWTAIWQLAGPAEEAS